jgi:hypothetical protein
MRPDAEYVEVVAGDQGHGHRNRAAIVQQADGLDPLTRQPGEHRVLIAQRQVGWIRKRVQAIAPVATGPNPFEPQLHQLTRVFNRQHPQQNLIDEPEDRGVGANAQRERGDGGQGEAGTHPPACPITGP